MNRPALPLVLIALATTQPACSPATAPDAGPPAADTTPSPPAPDPAEAPPDPAVVAAALRCAAAGRTAAIAARFRASAAEGSRPAESWEWLAWRTADRVVTRETRTDSGEAWFRGPGDRCSGFEHRLFREGWVIEYVAGDLAALGTERTWTAASSLVNPELLGTALRPVGTVDRLGLRCERFLGAGAGGSLVVVWSPELGLPVEIDRRTPVLRLRFVLLEVRPLAEAPWPEPRADDLRRVGFADVGDEPTEPFLRSLAHGRGPAFPGVHGHSACDPGFLRPSPAPSTPVR